jgi:exosortase B
MTYIQTFTDKWFGKGTDIFVLVALALGFAALYGPTYWDLSHTIWASDEQGHGPIILAVSVWLLFQRRHELAALRSDAAPALAILVFLLGMASYLVGRTQGIWILEVGSQILVLASLLLFFKGISGVECAWFVLFFMIFMVPLPGALVAALTAPLKSMVSAVASAVLYWFGYPIGRSGVLLTVGPYQLLVADACAGLNSMFTLEALGMLYMNIMGYKSAARNITLAVLIIPISFLANVIRVMILVLVTYHLGDEAGQGFVHGAAGMVLFIVALSLMLVIDNFLNLFMKDRTRKTRSQT